VSHWWGLRARLFVAFVALVVLTAAGVAGAMYVQARQEILQRAQDAAVESMLTDLQAQLPLQVLPPTDNQLIILAGALSNRTDAAAATYGDQWWGDLRRDQVPAELQAAVGGGRVAWQRVEHAGIPGLITGTRIGGTRVAVYSLRSLVPEEISIDGMATRAWLISGCALAVAVLLALVAAQGVLGPVRELTIELPLDSADQAAEDQALAEPAVQRAMGERAARKIIVVRNRVVNIVV
jgi:two-component system sensor histidine kinase MtrB